MARIPLRLREAIWARASGCCEYCQAPGEITLSHEIDHILPESAGGETTLDNLCLSCAPCNRHKHAVYEAKDPETDSIVSLFNPRLEAWVEHFTRSDDYSLIVGKTATGRATVARVKMNRADAVTARLHWIAVGWYPPT